MNFAGVTSPYAGAQTIVDIATAPEPASWALMLVGFASLALAGYRASRKIAALPA